MTTAQAGRTPVKVLRKCYPRFRCSGLLRCIGQVPLTPVAGNHSEEAAMWVYILTSEAWREAVAAGKRAGPRIRQIRVCHPGMSAGQSKNAFRAPQVPFVVHQ